MFSTLLAMSTEEFLQVVGGKLFCRELPANSIAKMSSPYRQISSKTKLQKLPGHVEIILNFKKGNLQWMIFHVDKY